MNLLSSFEESKGNKLSLPFRALFLLVTSSCHRLLGLLDAVDSVVHGQLVGLAFGDGGGFGCLDFPGSLECPSV